MCLQNTKLFAIILKRLWYKMFRIMFYCICLPLFTFVLFYLAISVFIFFVCLHVHLSNPLFLIVANSEFLDGVRVCNYRLKLDLMVAKSSSKTMLSLPEVMMMKMMMNCFCCMIGQQKGFSVISSWEHCQRSSPKGISDTL